MYKNSTFQEKFATLNLWLPSIIEDVKRDLKHDHLRNDPQFFKKYFASKNLQKLTSEEMIEAYTKALKEEENAEKLGEFMSSRWLFKNSEIYHFFETELSRIAPNFSELTEIERNAAETIIQKGSAEYGAPKVYLFAVLNSVVFPKEVFEQLSKEAEKEAQQEQQARRSAADDKSKHHEALNHQEELARVKDRYEKKLLGLQKKYDKDIESLKKQVSLLQRKLHKEPVA